MCTLLATVWPQLMPLVECLCLRRRSKLYWSLRSRFTAFVFGLEQFKYRPTAPALSCPTVVSRAPILLVSFIGLFLLICAPIVPANGSTTTASSSVSTLSSRSLGPYIIALKACNTPNSLVLQLQDVNSTMTADNNLSFHLLDGEYCSNCSNYWNIGEEQKTRTCSCWCSSNIPTNSPVL